MGGLGGVVGSRRSSRCHSVTGAFTDLSADSANTDIDLPPKRAQSTHKVRCGEEYGCSMKNCNEFALIIVVATLTNIDDIKAANCYFLTAPCRN